MNDPGVVEKKDVSVVLHAMSDSENCSSFPKLFLEWHYWMLYCHELSIELSAHGCEIPQLADSVILEMQSA